MYRDRFIECCHTCKYKEVQICGELVCPEQKMNVTWSGICSKYIPKYKQTLVEHKRLL